MYKKYTNFFRRGASSQYDRGYRIGVPTLLGLLLLQQPVEAVTKTAIVSNGEHTMRSIADVEGRVVDKNGKPLLGVSIKVKGMPNKATVTNNDGYFKMDVPAQTNLIISYVGFQTQEINTGQQNRLTITLQEDNTNLEEVVVVGYGVQKKVNLTGSVSSVSGEDLTKRQVVNPASMLEGLLPGVSVAQQSGQPGATNTSIQVRGMGTYSGAGTNPLVLINGVPGNMADLDPSTIASVSVLKDAASSAIYGAQAANGVVLVTTKDGSQNGGKFSVNYTANYGISNPTKLPKLVTNSVQYMELFNQAKRNSGITGDSFLYPESIIDLYRNPTDPIKYPNANWADLMFRSAPTFINNLSISGGQKTTFNASIGYVDEKGVMQAFDFKKYVAQFNLASQVSSKLKVGFNTNFNNGITSQPMNGAQDAFYQTIAHPPTGLPQLADGSGRYTYLTYPWESARVNQFAANNNLSRTSNYSVNAQVYTDLELAEGLHWYTKGAVNGYTERKKSFSKTIPLYAYLDASNTGLSSVLPGTGLISSMDQNIYTNVFSYLNYEKTLGNHHLDGQVGYSREENNYYFLQGSRSKYSVSSLEELNAGDATPQYNQGTSNAWSLQSFFGRLKYNYLQKYLFEANIRTDGSSRFASGHRWGVFPSFSAAWRISQENFLKEQADWLNEFKLRGSWGQLGNQNIGLYPYQAFVNIGDNYSFDGSNLITGAYQSALNSSKISWETTTMANIAFDATLFNHLDITFEAYKKSTTDILRPAQIAGSVGLDAPTINSGAMTNTGLELALNYKNKVNEGAFEGLAYNMGFNISGFKNKVTKYGALQDNGSTIVEEGKPWNTFYLLEWEGIFQTKEEVEKAPKQYGENTVPGDLKFKDTNGDGVVNDKDRTAMTKGVFPTFTYGFNINAAFKGFDFYVFLQGVEGQKGIFGYGRAPGLTPFFSGVAPTQEMAENAWTPENGSNTAPRLYFSDAAGSEKVWRRPSTYLLYDMSYLRVKSLQIGYTLPDQIVKRMAMSSLRFYVSGDNLFTFTKFPGLDPEKPTGGYLSYPQNRILSMGLSVKF